MEKQKTIYSIVIKDINILNDWSMLFSLYVPIIGTKAASLYLGLINECLNLKQLNNPKFEITRLYKMMALNEIQFNQAIKKLESLKLIKTKISKAKKVKKFEIYSPLEPQEFFDNDLFSKTLISQIGDENFESLKFLFKEKMENDLEEDFEDVTAAFSDVFPDTLNQMAINPTNEEGLNLKLQSSKKTLFEKMLDLKYFSNCLKEFNININYNTYKNKKLLNWALSLYNFNEKDLSLILSQAFNYQTQIVDLALFENLVQKFIFSKKHSKKNLNSENNPLYREEQDLSWEENQELEEWNQTSPNVFSQNLTGQQVDVYTGKLIYDLQHQYAIEMGGVNGLLSYSYYVNNRIVPNYIYKIADTLKNMSITKGSDIMIYLKHIKNKRNLENAEYPKFRPKLNGTDVQMQSNLDRDEMLRLFSKI